MAAARWLLALVAAALLALVSGFVGRFPSGRQSQWAVNLKKISDEAAKLGGAGSNNKDAAATGVQSGGKKKKGSKSQKSSSDGSEGQDWRAKRAEKTAAAATGGGAASPVPEANADADAVDDNANFLQMLAQDAATLAEVGEETVSAAAVAAAIEAAGEDDEESSADVIQFMETMSMAGAGGASSASSEESLFGDDDAEGSKKSKRRAAEAAGAGAGAGAGGASPLDALLKVPRKNPLSGGVLPPEVVFFGDPRRPPPVSAATDPKYRGTLLYWARHGNVVPRDSTERLARVFPKGKGERESVVSAHRLPESTAAGLSYELILSRFEAVMGDLEQAKAFIAANVDLVPSKLFQRALTAKKLAAQSKRNVAEMERLKTVRDRYIVAHDQLYFPLQIERLKAETRVMTYMARDEMRNFAGQWDTVEATLLMSALIAARISWDAKVQRLRNSLNNKLDRTLSFFVQSTADQFMRQQYRRPALTAETYRNASLAIQQSMPTLYAKVAPEVKALHETYLILGGEGTGEALGEDEGEDRYDEAQEYLERVFLPREGLSREDMVQRLKLFESNVAAIEGWDYNPVRQRAVELMALLSTEEELDQRFGWYHNMLRQGGSGGSIDYGFQTYQPDQVPMFVEEEQRMRDTDSAFTEFYMQVMKQPTVYTEAFQPGKRPKASEVGDWLQLDPLWGQKPRPDDDANAQMDELRKAYRKQMDARKEAEAALSAFVLNRMEEQDRVLGGSEKLVIEFGSE